MREGLYTNVNGVNVIDLYKVIGKGYENGWFTNCPVRYRLFEGARNTKKSKDIIGYESIFKIITDELRNIMVCRKNDSDLRQSAYENICGCIFDLGWQDRFRMRTSPLEIEYLPTGQKIIFRGLNSPTSLNSITFRHGFLTDVYIEEAFELDSYDDFRKLDGSLRGKLPEGYFLQITMCFNAWDGLTWLYTEFFKGRLEDNYEILNRDDVTYMDYYDPKFVGPYGKGLYLHKSTYKINEFRSPDYDDSAKEMRNKAPEIYKVEFLGMFGVTTGIVYDCWSDKLVKPIQDIIGVDDHGFPKYDFVDFSIGIDTGLSDGAGHVKTVKKEENQDVKIKAATTMNLVALTSDNNKLVCIDEYFHSNNKSDNDVNTDDREKLTEFEQLDRCCEYIKKWIEMYGYGPTILMRGTIKIYVDSADIGFRQGLEIKLREHGLYNCQVMASTKRPIRTRTAYTNLLMAYEDFIICYRCKNLIREFKNCRKGERNIPRQDGNDHCINAHEYAAAPFYPLMNRWKNFKER
jgi:phage terminase large subunit